MTKLSIAFVFLAALLPYYLGVCAGLPHHLSARISSSGSSVFLHPQMGEVNETADGQNTSDPDVRKPWPEDAVDMMVPPAKPGVRAAWTPRTRLWPKGESGLYEVPYHIKAGVFNEHQINNILFAMRILERSTNLKFIRLTEEDRSSRYHILFNDGSWCSSYVGYQISALQSVGYQELVLAGGDTPCRNLESIMHEMLHALGMQHEHQRPDRDEHVTVALTGYNYDIHEDIPTDTPYDLASTMQYKYSRYRLYAHDISLYDIQSSTSPTPSSCDYHWINTQYPGEKPAPPCVPNVVMEQCETLPQYQGRKLIEDHCRYECGYFLLRPRVEDGVYCKFITEEGSDLPIDPVTEYMKKLAGGADNDTSTTTTTTTTTTKSTTTTTSVSSRSHCCALPQYEYSPRMQEWCNWNDCHEKYCTVNKCKPLEIYKDMPNMQWWCDKNDCPSKYCVSDCETAV